jgi:hypothetical protein
MWSLGATPINETLRCDHVAVISVVGESLAVSPLSRPPL